MYPRIVRFLRHHHVLTLSTFSGQGSWTAHCFYALMPDQQSLVFTTDPETRHGREMLQNTNVSGGIMLETKVIGKIRGIQLTGRAFPATACHSCESVVTPAKAGVPSLTTALPRDTPHPPTLPMDRDRLSPASVAEGRKAYLKRFPFALAVKLDLWILHIDYIKMTDNRLGFGSKLLWLREDEVGEVRG